MRSSEATITADKYGKYGQAYEPFDGIACSYNVKKEYCLILTAVKPCQPKEDRLFFVCFVVCFVAHFFNFILTT